MITLVINYAVSLLIVIVRSIEIALLRRLITSIDMTKSKQAMGNSVISVLKINYSLVVEYVFIPFLSVYSLSCKLQFFVPSADCS